MRRSLIYFWRINLAVLLGAAVATAVLTGALLVGDSVRGSLKDLTLDRLGQIDYALISQRFFGEDLAAKLDQEREFAKQFEVAVPAIILNGTAVHVKSKSRASRINIHGIDERFTTLFDSEPENSSEDFSSFLSKKPGQLFPSIIINETLQRELNSRLGDQILISFGKPSDINRESLLGRRNTTEVIESVRLTLTKILPDRGMGRFSLRLHQSLPLNAFVSLSVLQKAINQKHEANTILVVRNPTTSSELSPNILQQIVHKILTLEDIGLKLRTNHKFFTLESEALILKPTIVETAKTIAAELNMPILSIFTYLANTLTANGRMVPYSTVAALNTSVGEPFDSLVLTNGAPAPQLADNEILLNQWATEDLGVKVGDSINMSYFVVGPRDELATKSSKVILKGILAPKGLAADPTLTPDFPGIHDANDMSEWDPPFPVDLNLIRPKDEAYWDKYRATPKAFVSWETGRRLWSSRFGNVTSIRFGAAPRNTLTETIDEFKKRLFEKILPLQTDFMFQPVKEQGLEAASGATDFGMLFIGFSLFLIVSAALLVGLLFRLGVEQRAQEIGLLLAVGYPGATLRNRFLKEGGTLAALGMVLGLGGAIFYAWLLMVGLRTWWLAAVGAAFLFLHIDYLSLLIGYFASLLVIVFSIWWAVQKLVKVRTPTLLAGVTSTLREAKPGRFARITAWMTLGLAMILVLFAFAFDATSSAGLFFTVGTCLLISGLAFFAIWLRSSHRLILPKERFATIVRMAARNAPRNPGRSLLSAALVGCACFVIVAVGANRRQFGEDVLRKNSGAGGFSLVAETDIPLHYDLNSAEARYELGFTDAASEIIQRSQIVPFRLLPGEDASCLNLYQPQKPRILGVPSEQINRGGFEFQKIETHLLEENDSPWSLLEQDLEPRVIPAFGDYNSVLWILHLGLGKDLVMQNEFGETIRLRLVGLFKSSLFQSELLISETDFLKHFPSQSGYAYFLIETPVDKITETAQILEGSLSDYGFDATTTVTKLTNYQAVENTYLSTFQTLGGLGLLLGTLGLGIILIRNVIERRGELATLRAFGFRRVTLAWLVLAENGFLLLLGILIGTISALIAVAPHLISGSAQVPWISLSMTLVLVLVVGMLASAGAVSAALRIPLLPALKAE
ncbi:MAG: FtsX-like permease family protein [bacterium]